METDIRAEIRGMRANDDKRCGMIARQVREEALRNVRECVDMARLEKGTVQMNARGVIQEIGGLAFSPLVESPADGGTEQLVWDLRQAVTAHREDLDRLVEKLVALLDDKRPVPMPEPPPMVEEKPDQRRVCDEAYLMARGLCAREDEEEAMANEREFLHFFTDEQRDEEIERFKRTKKWTLLTLRMMEGRAFK